MARIPGMRLAALLPITVSVVSILISFGIMPSVHSRNIEDLRVMQPAYSSHFSHDNPRGVTPEVKVNPGAISIISKDSWSQQGMMKPMPNAHFRKKSNNRNKKVDTQKFRECIFFGLCSKSECFHYGRYSSCH